MLTTPSTGRRLAGRALIAVAAAAALPLTASRATEYVDIPPPETVHPGAVRTPTSALAPAAAAALAASAAPESAANGELPYPDLGGVGLGKNDVAFMSDDTILINGQRKTVEQLNASERARLRHAIASSKQDIARDRQSH